MQKVTEAQKAKTYATKKRKAKTMNEAILNSLSTEWQLWSDFQDKIRKYFGNIKKLEYYTITCSFDTWVEKNSTREVTGKNKVIMHEPVEWKNPHTPNAMLRLINKSKGV